MPSVLPIPTGRFAVGSITKELIDHKRPTSLAHTESGRRLFVKIWYPCVEPHPKQRCERLWEQLLSDSSLPWPMRCLSKWVSRYPTSTYTNAKFNPQCDLRSVVVYNHGLIGFASENTAMAEHLVSHGHLLIAVQHLDQLQEFRELESKLSTEEKERNKLLVKKLQSDEIVERQEAAVDFYENAINTNAITSARASDSQFVIDNLDSLLDCECFPQRRPDKELSLAAIGLSLGGAVSMELAKREPRVVKVVNIDGGNFGESRNLPLTASCSMIYSEPNSNINEQIFSAWKNPIESVTIGGAKHINFHDIALIFPLLLRLLGAVGKSNVKSVIGARNNLLTNFLEEKCGG